MSDTFKLKENKMTIKYSKMNSKIKSFKIYTDDADEDKVLIADSIFTALEILENNSYIVEVKYEDN